MQQAVGYLTLISGDVLWLLSLHVMQNLQWKGCEWILHISVWCAAGTSPSRSPVPFHSMLRALYVYGHSGSSAAPQQFSLLLSLRSNLHVREILQECQYFVIITVLNKVHTSAVTYSESEQMYCLETKKSSESKKKNIRMENYKHYYWRGALIKYLAYLPLKH